MDNVEKLIEKAYKNGKTINMDDILDLDLGNEEFDIIIKRLQAKQITILNQEYNLNSDKDFSADEDIVRQYYNEISKIPLLTELQEKELFAQYQTTRDIELRNKLVEHNLRLVVRIAKQYSYRLRRSSNQILDIIQAGNEGLMRAVEKFDVSMGTRISTYATWWIKVYIRRYLNETENIIRLPLYLIDVYNKILKYKIESENKNEVIPSDCEIAKILGISEETVLKAIYENEKIIVSLDDRVGTEKTETLIDLISYDDCSLEESIVTSVAGEQLIEMMKKCLNDQEYLVLSLRCGIINEINDNKETTTLEKIGKKINLSKEMVRKIEKRAYKKLSFFL